MAPARAKKAKASPADSASAQYEIMATKSPARTPLASPSKRGLITAGITANQKQALIDNLQLEVTERARKLRAQYALQAQSLRTRIEMRVNRIPSGLRKVKMGDLYEKYIQVDMAAKSQSASTSGQTDVKVGSSNDGAISRREFLNTGPHSSNVATTKRPTEVPLPRGRKRTSDVFDSDKENPNATISTSTEPKPIPNKKQRTNTKNSSHPSHQNQNPSTILSPKSANSRTLPSHHSKADGILSNGNQPNRPTSPLKAYISPMKPKTALTGGRSAKTTSNATTAPTAAAKTMGPPPPPQQANKSRGRKAAASARPVEIHDDGSVRTVSSASNASTGTTIVKKASGDGAKRGGAKLAKTAAGKKTAASASAAAATASIGEEKAGPTVGRRLLRKR